MGTSPDEFKTFVTEEIARWKKVIADADIKMPQ
jgi:tripartite-type tricarboxylate transporter receptor subunit TctC